MEHSFSLLLVLLCAIYNCSSQTNCGDRKTCGDCMADAECFWCLDNPEAVTSFPKCFSRRQVSFPTPVPLL